MTFDPTDEQTEAMGLFAAGLALGIEAGAGTGKTSTLELLARTTHAPGTYLAFNAAPVNDAAQRMPVHVQSRTAHSVAFRQTGRPFQRRLNGARVPSWELAKMLDTPQFRVMYDGKWKTLGKPFLASLVMRTLKVFAFSADPAPRADHVPYVEGIDERGSEGQRRGDNNRQLANELEPWLSKAWADVCDPAGTLPYTHDYYLKLWQLTEPRIPGSFVLFDECQDASPVMLDAVAKHADASGAQVVLVGDSQQAIYGWRGAVNAFDHYDLDATTWLSQSFRFGPAIANVANLVLARLGSPLCLRGLDALASKVDALTNDQADVFLYRTNAGAVTKVMQLLDDGIKPHLVGGTSELVDFAHAAGKLQAGETTGHPELACFSSWGEVQDYVENDPQGDELSLLVKLIDEWGVQIVVDALAGLPGEQAADVIVSTAHKAKGREWDHVKLGNDFPEAAGRKDEYRLLYVAATRAKRVLDPRAAQSLMELIHAPGGAA